MTNRLLLIMRVSGPGRRAVAHALRTVGQKKERWNVKGWNNTWWPDVGDGNTFNFLDYMHCKGQYWETPDDPCLYEIKLLIAKYVPE